ncbi:hypothetical protein PF005_g23629 [Phytophthora fragariae]|uniref:Secreted protein n=1 Tax=Phytophthora fragariae TaxID=53985 RepID=A0A6A3WBY1_9STRA|nr:hypothetical protein PF003_g9589 [Phytophthora fragariae]KAE8925118.1 hypothetical protein PF009_g24665 [Phytophthora fragariae]KAE8979976.1 hypothetical protein PF011_g22630 [Phytophthora fragariae]KAE9078330.1 hypothetical protein PF007_g23910 [Phytophthora fragariae]KAE9099239.1 hypothetical protein PF006_g23184 [Phytophthora fragariae]
MVLWLLTPAVAGGVALCSADKLSRPGGQCAHARLAVLCCDSSHRAGVVSALPRCNPARGGGDVMPGKLRSNSCDASAWQVRCAGHGRADLSPAHRGGRYQVHTCTARSPVQVQKSKQKARSVTYITSCNLRACACPDAKNSHAAGVAPLCIVLVAFCGSCSRCNLRLPLRSGIMTWPCRLALRQSLITTRQRLQSPMLPSRK